MIIFEGLLGLKQVVNGIRNRKKEPLVTLLITFFNSDEIMHWSKIMAYIGRAPNQWSKKQICISSICISNFIQWL